MNKIWYTAKELLEMSSEELEKLEKKNAKATKKSKETAPGLQDLDKNGNPISNKISN